MSVAPIFEGMSVSFLLHCNELNGNIKVMHVFSRAEGLVQADGRGVSHIRLNEDYVDATHFGHTWSARMRFVAIPLRRCPAKTARS